MAVPFVDLRPANAPLKRLLLVDFAKLIDEGDFTGGRPVALFERAFAAYCSRAFCVGTASGLDALRLGLLSAGLHPGDEVIVPAHTFVATFEAVTQAGGRPLVCDVTDADHNIDVSAVEAALTPRTRFVLPVHLYGQMADMRTLATLASRFGLTIVEDACQAHGAERDGLRPGAASAAAAFSFYPAKNLGAMGDAGALVTDDGDIDERARSLREHGQTQKYWHECEGYTARLDTIQAIVLLRKLEQLDAWNAARCRAADFYSAELQGVGDLRLPPVPAGSKPVWHLYVVRTADPDQLASFLADRRIGTGRHYPQPPHISPAYESLGHGPGAFPVAEALAREALSFPIFPGITEAQLAAVVAGVKEFFKHG